MEDGGDFGGGGAMELATFTDFGIPFSSFR